MKYPLSLPPFLTDIKRLKSLQKEVLELMNLWNQLESYEERCFVMARISKMQNEVLDILEKQRLHSPLLGFHGRSFSKGVL